METRLERLRADYQVNALRVPHIAIEYLRVLPLSEGFEKTHTTFSRTTNSSRTPNQLPVGHKAGDKKEEKETTERIRLNERQL